MIRPNVWCVASFIVYFLQTWLFNLKQKLCKGFLIAILHRDLRNDFFFFFSSDTLLFPIYIWTVFPLFYLDFYSLFCLDFISFLDFYFFFGLLFHFLYKSRSDLFVSPEINWPWVCPHLQLLTFVVPVICDALNMRHFFLDFWIVQLMKNLMTNNTNILYKLPCRGVFSTGAMGRNFEK